VIAIIIAGKPVKFRHSSRYCNR